MRKCKVRAIQAAIVAAALALPACKTGVPEFQFQGFGLDIRAQPGALAAGAAEIVTSGTDVVGITAPAAEEK